MNNSKNSVRTLTMLALLVAMSIVFSQVLSISTGFVRFNLGSLPVLLAALLFGPGAGFAVGRCGRYDRRRCWQATPSTRSSRWARVPLVWWRGLHGRRCPGCAPACGCRSACCWDTLWVPMVITSLALRIFYGYPWATLAVRIPNALILAAVNTVLLRILLENRTLMKMVKK